MTPFGAGIGRELLSALVPLETVTIANHPHLPATMRALLKNALFYVVPTPAIDAARDHALARAENLAAVIRDVGVHPQGISLLVDQARSEAIVALEALIDGVADAEPTVTARSLGIA